MPISTIINKKSFLLIAAVLAFFAAGFFWGSKNNSVKNEIENNTCQTSLRFLNREIACDFNEEKNLEITKNLETQMGNLAKSSIQNKKADKISVFFRDLSSKKFVALNANEKFIPASLLKLPLVIAYYKLGEIQPEILSRQYSFATGTLSYNEQYFSPAIHLKENIAYSIKDLMRQTLVYSDNNSLSMLWNSIDNAFLNRVFEDLSIPMTEDPNTNTMSAQIYSSLLRILYNSSYLNRENSEQILDWLNQTDFNDGLMAGLPSDVIVSHKFGERSSTDSTTSKELHDCGIVYYPAHPYIICVMTSGQDYKNLSKIISEISRLTYEEMKKY
jgi:beta-lactamase class A